MLVVAYALFLVIWLVARQLTGERWWWISLLDTFPAWPFLLAPAALLLAAFDRRPIVLAAAALPALLWLGVFGWRYLPRWALTARAMPAAALAGQEASAALTGAGAPLAAGAGGQLRVLAFNVLYTNDDAAGIVAAIRHADADVLALPELTPAMDVRVAGEVGDRYPYRLRATLPGARFGTGIYSRWPLDDLGTLKTGLGLRSAVADVRTPFGVIRFVALHPRATLTSLRSYGAFTEGIDKCFRDREKQLVAVCGYVDQWRDRPLVLAGDFNMTEFSEAYRCLGQRLHDAYREAGRGLGQTWPARTSAELAIPGLPTIMPLTRIDFVWHSDHLRATAAQVLADRTGSDHRPVLVTLRMSEMR